MMKTFNEASVSAKYIGSILGGNLSIKAHLLEQIVHQDRKFSGYYMPETQKFVLIESIESQVLCFRESYNFAAAFNFNYEPLGKMIAEKYGFKYANTVFLTLQNLIDGEYEMFANPYGLDVFYKGGIIRTDNLKCPNGREITEYLFDLDMQSSFHLDHDFQRVVINQVQEQKK